MLSSSRVARTLALTAVPLAALILAGPAAAATKNGITPLAPKAGTSVPAGKSATFRMRVNNPGAGVFMHVCKSSKKDKQGMICKKATIPGLICCAGRPRVADLRPFPRGPPVATFGGVAAVASPRALGVALGAGRATYAATRSIERAIQPRTSPSRSANSSSTALAERPAPAR